MNMLAFMSSNSPSDTNSSLSASDTFENATLAVVDRMTFICNANMII